MKHFPTIDLVKSELKLQLNLQFYMLLVVSFAIGFVITKALPSDAGIAPWSPLYLTRILLTLGFLIPIFQSILVIKATVRDVQHQTESLVFTTPISKAQFLFSRWFGVFCCSLCIYLALPIGIGVSLTLNALQTQVAIDYSSMISALAWASVIFLLPGLILSSVVMFAVGLFGRSALHVYLAALFSFFLYQTLVIITGSPMMAQPFVLNDTLKVLFDLFDPIATSEYYQQIKQWSAEQRNDEQIALTHSLVVNRGLVLTLAIAIGAIVYKLFRLSLTENKPTSKANKPQKEVENTNKQAPKLVAIMPQFSSPIFSVWALVKTEYLTSIKTKTFVFIIALCAFIIGSNVLQAFTYLEPLGVTPVASTTIAINEYISSILPKLIYFFLILITAEIMWRDKELNVADLIDTTPTTSAQLLMAKWVTLLLIPITFITVAILVSMGLQVVFQGNIEIDLYASLYFYVGLPAICVATLLLFVNAISSNKITAIIISLLIILFSQTKLSQIVGIEHHLLKFATFPAIIHSELTGFSANNSAFLGYMLLWSSISLLSLLVSFHIVKPGRDQISLRSTLVDLKRMNPASKVMLVFISGLVLYAAGHVYFQTNIAGNYVSKNEANQWRADYENAYKKYENLAQPTVVNVVSNIDLYPNQGRYETSATFTLENKTTKAISTILVSTHKDVNYTNVELENAELSMFDETFHQYLFTLNKPLPPKARINLTFSANRAHNNFNGTVSDSFFSPKFVYLRDVRYRPQLGFNRHYILKNNNIRKEYQLPTRNAANRLEQEITKFNDDFSFQYQWANIETIVSTRLNHIAVAPGKLINHKVERDRQTFHYKTEQPIRHIQPVISGEFAVSKTKVDDVSVEVYHLPKHAAIAKEHIEAMADTLAFANESFGQYPAKQLRLIATPNAVQVSGFAMPQTILLDEKLGFAVDRSNQSAFDHLYRRTVHETAHQWWGLALDSANIEGASVLSETLSNYTQEQVLNRKYGKKYHNRLMQYANDRYFFARSNIAAPEKPLYRADEPYLLYSKGTIAMNNLAEQLGDDAVNHALRNLFEKYRYPNKPATSLDLIEELNLATQFKHKRLVNQWFKQVIVNDWSIKKESVVKVDANNYQVNFCINNKLVSPSHQTVKVGIFSSSPDLIFAQTNDESTILETSINYDPIEPCVSFMVSSKPAYLAVDPYFQSLDQNRENNSVSLTLMESKHD